MGDDAIQMQFDIAADDPTLRRALTTTDGIRAWWSTKSVLSDGYLEGPDEARRSVGRVAQRRPRPDGSLKVMGKGARERIVPVGTPTSAQLRSAILDGRLPPGALPSVRSLGRGVVSVNQFELARPRDGTPMPRCPAAGLCRRKWISRLGW